jgi:polysaccharide chain length determinant protein (PEP-CTERM system associated)
MKLLNLNNPQDLMALMVRRKWWIVVPFFALSCAAVLLTYMLPKMYVSQALVLVQPRDVPDEIVKDALAGSTENRLSAIKEAVLSRTSLLDILREFDSSLPEFQSLNLDQKVETLRNQIEIDLDANTGNGRAPVTYFRISFRGRNPETAQKIAEKVTAVFIEKDNQARETKVDSVTSFVSTELEKITEELNASEAKLRSLKALRRESLPEQTPANLSTLERLEQRRSTDYSQLALAQTRLENLEQFINVTPEKVPTSNSAIVAPPVEKDPLVEDYLTTRAHKEALIARGYTEKFPDVVIDTNHLESLKKQISPEALTAALSRKDEKPTTAVPTVATVANPAYLNYMADKATLKKGMDELRKDIAEVEDQITKYDARVQNAPKTEQELQDVLRENIDLNKRYQSMNDSLNKAQISQSLESRQQSSPLRIADPANYPLSPTKPSKPAIAGVGIMLSLLIGIALAIIVDVANQKMWTLSEVEALLGTTVLVEIPEIVTPSDLDENNRRKKIYLASFTILSTVYGVCLYLAYLHQGFVLKQLEPVIKRLY